ncbi:Retrovirus-related Pol polyprotein from transposon gypsy [Trichinella nelsoni]|uniref:Retrovirus-related Pol polyprotein from transposon gypsy n=1 Tax=Trichinella nelsoni TaxID=6336 RepID=A0A0V0SFJ6_9BILA|nr:Retrovirus-related Pol polyprotein from transposon gypsy [Trichinella nelsoni]
MSMDRFLKPERLDVDPSSPTSSEQWKHWLATFEKFLAALPQENLDKKSLLINFVSPRTYSSTAGSCESLDEFLRALNALAVACDCKAVTAVQYQEELVRDAFVRGIRSQTIRQRLLESRSFDLASIYELASVHDAVLRSSENYNESRSLPETVAAAANDENNDRPLNHLASSRPLETHAAFSVAVQSILVSSARRVKQLAINVGKRITMLNATLASVGSTFPHSLAKAVVKILLCGKEINCMIDSGSSESFIHPEVFKRLGLKTIPSSEPISMASSALPIKALGCITVDLKVQDRLYKSFLLRVLPHLCADVILGQDFHRMHESVTLNYGGNLPPLIICGIATLRVDPPKLFAHLTPDCRPIATTSRKFSAEDTNFIRNEVRALLEDGIIEPSISPWRAQVVVLKDERRKKCLVVDYSATINSTIDLKSAYHQIPIPNDEKLYTAFEADGSLYQFTRIPFGVTNDDVTVCGMSQDDHDKNLEQFLSSAKRWNFTFNTDKCSFSTSKLRILGHEIKNGNIRPDPQGLQSLALKSQGLPTEQWPAVLPDAPHAVRSLLCTSTNAMPHERVLAFPRRSTSGRSIPAWLLGSKSALLKKHVRNSKTDPLVEKVRLLEGNPTYAYVRFPDGRESSVSTRHLAPAGSSDAEEAQQEVTAGDDCSENCEPLHRENEEKTTLRRLQRIRRPPQRLDL